MIYPPLNLKSRQGLQLKIIDLIHCHSPAYVFSTSGLVRPGILYIFQYVFNILGILNAMKQLSRYKLVPVCASRSYAN